MLMPFFYRRRLSDGPANVVRAAPPFRLLDRVRLTGQTHARTYVVTGLRESAPGVFEAFLTVGDGAGTWWPEAFLRAAPAPLTVIEGGKR